MLTWINHTIWCFHIKQIFKQPNKILFKVWVKYLLFARYLNSWIPQDSPLEQVLQISKSLLVVRKNCFLGIKFELLNFCWCNCSQLHIFACEWITASSAYSWQTSEILLAYMLNSNIETHNWHCVGLHNLNIM